MRKLRGGLKNKRAVSEVVAYVLLISIGFAIAGSVYAWLKFYVEPTPEAKCPDGIDLSISSYVYNCVDNTLNLTLQNRGRFNVTGYVIRVNNHTNSSQIKIGVYTLNKTGRTIVPGEEYNDFYKSNTTAPDDAGYTKPIKGTLSFLEIQPYVKDGTVILYCSSIGKVSLSCS